jgi:beta-glucosidase
MDRCDSSRQPSSAAAAAIDRSDDAAGFPPGFSWGASTSAYQVEGAFDADGRGESIWDRFSHAPGATRAGDTGDVACDSYHRYAEDVALLQRLNLNAYRFSISWPRIQPLGEGAANSRGIAYYDRLVDALLAAGIRPMATLYHWDLPQALEERGGWPERDTAQRFADYASIVANALADRVGRWLILNEPMTFTGAGYWYGVHAPGRKDPAAFLRATHTVNLAQGNAFRALKAIDPKLQIGSAFDAAPMFPASASYPDVAAAERWHRFQNLWFIHPALHGCYPAGVLTADRQEDLLGWRAGDEAIVRAPLDFLGLNYYSPSLVSHAPQGNGLPGLNVEVDWAKAPGSNDTTDIGWDVSPSGLYHIVMRIAHETGNLPLEITENGAAYDVGPGADGEIHDTQRITYLRAHLCELARAIRDGAPVRGYHCWSLLDNFEWARGYSQRFGLVHVDFAQGQRRTIKDSGHWYARVAAANRVA